MTGEPWPRRRAVLAAVIAVVVYNLPSFIFPFFEDTGLFAAFGHYMWHGLVPYRDLLDQKPPGIFFVTALTSKLLGDSSVASRAVELGFIVVAALGAGAIVREIDERAEPAAIVICGAMFSALMQGLPERGQVEIYQAVFLAWGAALVLRHLSAPSLRRIAGAGVLIGLGCWFKPQAGLFGVAAAVLVAGSRARARAWRDLVRDELALAGGAIAASLPFLAYLAATGALGAFARVAFVDNRVYLTKGASPPLSFGLRMLLPHGTAERVLAVFLVGAIVGLGLQARRDPRSRRGLAVLGAWLAAAVLQYYSGRYFFKYHRLVLIVPEAALAGLGLALGLGAGGRLARRRVSARITRILQASAVGAIVLGAGLDASYLTAWRLFADAATGTTSLETTYRATGHEMRYFDFLEQEKLADYIRAHTRPGDAVQVLGRAGVFYLYVDRPPASRYLVTSAPFDPHRPDRAAHLARLLADLRRTRPAYILVRTSDRFPWFGLDDSLALLRASPDAMAFVSSNYDEEGVFANEVVVLRRRDPR